VDLTASTSGDDDSYTNEDNRIYATSKFETSNFDHRSTNIDWIENKKTSKPVEQNLTTQDSDNSNKLFSYPGKSRNKLKSTLNHLNDATILALYGDNFESEPILQIRVRIIQGNYLNRKHFLSDSSKSLYFHLIWEYCCWRDINFKQHNSTGSCW
jgi:hypothetical protein